MAGRTVSGRLLMDSGVLMCSVCFHCYSFDVYMAEEAIVILILLGLATLLIRQVENQTFISRSSITQTAFVIGFFTLSGVKSSQK